MSYLITYREKDETHQITCLHYPTAKKISSLLLELKDVTNVTIEEKTFEFKTIKELKK